CGSTVVPFWRSFSSGAVDHFYTTNATERDEFIAAGYTLEGTAAWVYTDGICGSHPLFRLFNPEQADHFYTSTINADERDSFIAAGYVFEGTAGFVYNRQICGSTPLFRVFNPVDVDHFYTTSPLERDASLENGYVDQGVAAYVPVAGVTVNNTLC
ncbi:hypothetical protein FB451DRAFT_1046486, partial [Mycena latifolia]